MAGSLGKKLTVLILLAVFSILTSSCSRLAGSLGSGPLGYSYPGVSGVVANGDGTFTVSWSAAPIADSVVFQIFIKEGTDTDPTGRRVSYNFRQPDKEIKDASTSYVTSNLNFSHNTCFVVRINYKDFVDTNTNEICTNHERFVFSGMASLAVRSGGRFALAWPAVPDKNVVYSVYSRKAGSSSAYDFSAEPLLKSTDTVAVTDPFPLNETRCFLVRFRSQSFSADANNKELCSGDDGVADFLGVESVTSVIAGQAKINWVRSVNASVVGYNVYQGNNFQLEVGVAQASANSLVVTGLPPGERREFAVRAFDKFGREDDNTKTISVLISDLQVAQGDFAGCESATGLDTSRIQVTVAFPDGASAMKVYRDGVLVSTLTSGSTMLVDDRLSEASTYTYRCEALIAGIPTQGTATVQGTTANLNPPNFAGLQSVTRVAAGQARLDWNALGDGPKAKEFRIYRRAGLSAPALSSENLVATVSGDARQVFVSNLGDELRYTFVVSACTALNLCAGQSKTVTSDLLPDEGIPKTPGATSVRMVSGKAVITAPWTHDMGGIAKRRIYMRNPNAASPVIIDNFAYELVRAEVVTDIYNPPTELEVSGLLSGTSYSFVVRDEDSQGNVSLNKSLVSVNSGDITPPAFAGIGQLLAGSNPESELSVSFTAVAAQSATNPDGPSQYLVYVSDVAPPAAPSDSCNLATPVVQVSASNAAAGTTVTQLLSGLTPRRTYSVCVKARDEAGNISLTTSSLTKTTQDKTPPLFDGVQTFAYNNASTLLELRWNPASSSTNDVRNYRITLFRCAATTLPDCSASTDRVSLTSVSTTGVDLPKSTFSPALASNDKVTVVVNACDNASPDFSSVDNCTTSARLLSVVLPDIDPPSGFSGIVSAAAVTGSEGTVRVGWSAPSSWSDYRGFKVYTVNSNETLTFLRDCPCTAAGCPEQPTSCDISSLEARRSYNFFVRAYDTVNNMTALPPSTYASSRAATTLDLTPPTFVSNLNASFVGTGTRGVSLSWSAATDNQASNEFGASLTYKVYRKVGSTFTGLTPSTPPTDGVQLLSTASTSYVNGVANLAANTTEYYVVCAFDASSNVRCDSNAVRQVNIPRLSPPSFPAGIQSLAAGSPADTTLTLTFNAIVSETADPAAGATDYPVYVLESTLPAEPANACSSTSPAPVLKGVIVGTSFTANQLVTYNVSGLNPRKKYSVCVKARDSLGNESLTTAALTAVTQDITAPTFNGLQNAAYNGSAGTIDLSWTPSTSVDVRNYAIKMWTTGGQPSVVFKTPSEILGGTLSITKTDFPFTSNDEVRIVVNACDDAAPTYASLDNCTTFADNTARVLTLPDVDPPANFAGIVSAADVPVRTTGAVRITWSTLADWSDVRGFKIYDVMSGMSLLKDCACTDYGCSNRLTSCDVTGLDAGRTFRFYVRAYDAAGNESLIANPNPITNVKNFRTADLVPPAFSSGLLGSYSNSSPQGILLSWNAATDNQYAAEPNTLGYRLYRKQGTPFTNTSRTTIESEGTRLSLIADTDRLFLDPVTGLMDGVTYYYTVCAFDREPEVTGGNTTCDGTVRSVTVPDITPPVVSNLTGSRTLLTRSNPSFNLSWTLSDNVTPANNIVVTVRKKINATSGSDFPAPDAAVYQTGVGLASLTSEEGADNVNAWVTYRLTVADTAGNERSTATFAIQSNRAAVPVVIGTPSVSLLNASGTVSFPVSYTGAASILASAQYLPKIILTTISGTATCDKAVSGTGLLTRSVNLSNCLGNGTVAISLAAGTALDADGNESAAAGPSATFTVDNLAPLLTISSPSAYANFKDVFTLTGVCEGTLSISISSTGILNSPQSTVCSGNAFSVPLTLTGADGLKFLTVVEEDGAGNLSSLTLSLVKDTVVPTVAISSPASASVFSNANVPVALSGTCESGLAVVLEGDVPANQSTSCSGGAFSFSSWQVNSGDGGKSVTVSQTDAAGNKGSASRNYSLDTTPVPLSAAAQFDPVTVVNALHYTFTGTCDSSGTYTTTASTTLGRVVSTSCVANMLKINIADLPERRNTMTVTATVTRNANGTIRSTTANFTQQFFCPAGYVGVPGKFATDSDTAGLGNVNASANNSNAGLDPTRDFCVMKYPAKVATSNNGGQQAWEPVYDGNKTFTMANYWPESRAHSTPWENISRDDSIDRCKALNEAYGHCSGTGCYSTFDNTTWGYRLMSNTQWQVIARNLESTGANWTSGTVGTEFLWRGHSDIGTGTNTDLHTQTFSRPSHKLLSHPKSDAGNSDYFGTGNNLSQNTNGSAGWQERRRFVLSNGTSVWDMAGNLWQWVSDDRSALGIPAADDTAGMSGDDWYSYLNGSSNRFSATGNLIFGNLGSGGLQFSEGQNAGLLRGGLGGAVLRGGGHGADWNFTYNVGLFAANLWARPDFSGNVVGFRCVFVPPPLTGPLDTGAPAVAVQRVDAGGVAVANNSVTVSAGGFWNLGISVSDAENTLTKVNLIRVQVRRKIATSSTDFPSATDPIYKSGFNLTSLPFETAWELNSTTNQYTRNDGTYVNYLVTAIDPAGNTGSATFSVQNTKSCPPGYVGVPGNSTEGLGNANATLGNANASLDPSREFCVMKYPAKVMSAGTTAAQSTVGGLFEPIMNGNANFANNYWYSDAATFASGITYLPESRSSGTPWVSISRDDSMRACRALQMQYFGSMPDTTTGTGFQLMSNTQWQVVARNAEAQAVNWSNNAVGNGVLNRGHSDFGANDTNVTNNSWSFESPGSLANSISDLNSYFATGNTATKAWNAQGTSIEASSEQKRTHTLSNGAVMWDMAGNVCQWVSDNNFYERTSDDMGVSDTVRDWWYQHREYSDAGLTASDQLIFSGAGNYTSSKNAGQIGYGGRAGAVLRGGAWGGGGLFSADLGNHPSNMHNAWGFRCVFLP